MTVRFGSVEHAILTLNTGHKLYKGCSSDDQLAFEFRQLLGKDRGVEIKCLQEPHDSKLRYNPKHYLLIDDEKGADNTQYIKKYRLLEQAQLMLHMFLGALGAPLTFYYRKRMEWTNAAFMRKATENRYELTVENQRVTGYKKLP